MTTYEEICNYLFSQVPSFEKSGQTGFNEGLANTLALDVHYNHPHRAFKTVHVAGTNGKGSVSHTLAAHLQAAGYRVGLFTSPHLVDFRERIRINGQMIAEQYVVDFVNDFITWNKAEGEPVKSPSFFELTTAMAFCYFKEEQVDIAVIEVGLGGRLDCTNIITPLLSVITNISLDHTNMLGNTLAEIAGEKAGIIKPGVPVVIGETHPETRPVFEQKAHEMHAPIIFAEDEPLVSGANGHYRFQRVAVFDAPQRVAVFDSDHRPQHSQRVAVFDGDLKGSYQLKNTNTALHALLQLKALGILKEVSLDPFNHVAETTGLMGRWQQLQDHPAIVCDTGHNVGGWEYLSRQLAEVNCHEMHIVFGMVNDKDVRTVMTMLPKNAHYYFTKAPTHRAINEAELKAMGAALGLQGNAYPTVSEAVTAAKKTAAPNDFIFIGGSTYVVAEYMKSGI